MHSIRYTYSMVLIYVNFYMFPVSLAQQQGVHSCINSSYKSLTIVLYIIVITTNCVLFVGLQFNNCIILHGMENI